MDFEDVEPVARKKTAANCWPLCSNTCLKFHHPSSLVYDTLQKTSAWDVYYAPS